MRRDHIYIGALFTGKELLRNRVTIVLFFLLPTLFYTIVILVTKGQDIALQLGALGERGFVRADSIDTALIFMGLTVAGLLTSYCALNLVQKHAAANRRLLVCGYKPSELMVSKVVVLLAIIFVISGYVATLLWLYFRPERIWGVAAGIGLVGFVYACYGLLVGALFRRELEGILMIVLLANLDAGWLQNPIYYADAQNKILVRALPAFYPSQTSLIAAFTQDPVVGPMIGSLLYGSAFLAAALVIYWLTMRIYGRREYPERNSLNSPLATSNDS